MSEDVLEGISLEQLERVAAGHGLGAVLGSERLGGSFGNNLALTTERGPWVLRLALPWIEADELRRERFFARTLHERSSLASPWPYIVAESSELLGRPYALMPLLPGVVITPWADVPWDRVGPAMGRAVAALHRIEFPAVSTWNPEQDALEPIEASASDWFLARSRSLAEAAGLDATSSAFVESVVADGVTAIGEFTPTYVHGDLGIANLVAERRADDFTFTGVFDLGGGFAGDPDEDLAIPIWLPLYFGNAVMPRAFLDSYRAEHPARAGEATRLRAYVAVSLLSNWEVGQRLGRDWYSGIRSFREWALPLLERADEVVAHRS